MVTIRAAGDGDVDVVRTLLREYAAYLNASVGEEHICLGNYEKELMTLPAPYHLPGGGILLATVAGEPAGVVALKPLTPMRSVFQAERACEMKRLWVRPQHRGLRLGKLLSEELIEQARARLHWDVFGHDAENDAVSEPHLCGTGVRAGGAVCGQPGVAAAAGQRR